MTDFLSVVFSSFPPIIAPLAFFLVLFRLLPTPSSLQSDRKASLRRIVVLTSWTLLTFFVVTFIDELYNDSNLRISRNSEPSFSSEHMSRPVLPPTVSSKYDEIRSTLVEQQQQYRKPKTAETSAKRWALVTGASSGIGRSIAIQFARRNIPLILVARDRRDRVGKSNLDQVAQDLRQCYGVDVIILRGDLSLPGEAQRIHTATSSAGLFVPYLILNAGYAPTALHVDHKNIGDIESSIFVNAQSASVLASLYGAEMQNYVAKTRRENQSTSNRVLTTPRILFVSSITASAPGLPGAANYGATKAFISSLARALMLEMEPMGIEVTLLIPGATRTNFAKTGGLEKATCWDIPFLSMDSDDVADKGVEAMFRGAKEIIPGILNMLYVRVFMPIFPTRFALRFSAFFWAPWPNVFKIGPFKTDESSDVCTEKEKNGSIEKNVADHEEKTYIDYSTLQNRVVTIEYA